jgi:hypothetical protein
MRTRFVRTAGASFILITLGSAAPGVPTGGDIRVRTNEAFAPCLGPALQAFSRESGLRVIVDIGEPDPPRGADVVVGDDSEITRMLEGGVADLATNFDLGALPWVLVVPKGSPAGALSALAPDRVVVFGGAAGRAARSSLQAMSPERLRVSRDAGELRAAAYALVPRSLAGPGEHRPSSVRPLIASATLVADSARAEDARRLLAFLRSDRARGLLTPCFDALPTEAGEARASAASGTAASYARSVIDWWLPDCSLTHNGYNDPGQVLGAPDAVALGAKDAYRGIMSLGQGGYVTVDLGDSVIDGPGADLRVYQMTGTEPVSVYAAGSAQGPFVLVGLRVDCGERTPGMPNPNHHCDFDLRGSGVAETHYLKIEDGEIYPCLAGGTITEGADIDAIEILNKKP